MRDMVRKSVLGVKPYTPGKPIEEVERELGIKGVVKLASNENCLGPSPKAIAAARRQLGSVHRYPDASCYYLKKKLSKKLGVTENMLMLANGSDEAIVVAIRTFVGEGQKVIIAKPTFLIYEIASQIANTEMKFVPLTKDFKYDLGEMKREVTPNTRMIFIANPDNPSGTFVSKRELDEFFSGLPSNVIVILDEAYFEFANYEAKDYPNGLTYLNKPNVIVTRSFSKVYGLAGLRIGYAIANPEVIEFMERVRDPFNVNLLAQSAALAALDDQVFVKKTLNLVAKEKKYLYNAFDDMELKYVRSATNFVIVDVRKDSTTIFKDLLKKGIIVRDMKAWGFNSYIRVTVGTRMENIKFIKALRSLTK